MRYTTKRRLRLARFYILRTICAAVCTYATTTGTVAAYYTAQLYAAGAYIGAQPHVAIMLLAPYAVALAALALFLCVRRYPKHIGKHTARILRDLDTRQAATRYIVGH